MSAILGQFSEAIRNAVQTPALDGQINQVCAHEYQTQQEAQEALQELERSLVGNLTGERRARVQDLFYKILLCVPPRSLTDLPVELTMRIISYLPPESRIPLVCRRFFVEQRAVHCQQILEFCQDNNPVCRFRQFGFRLRRREEEIRNFDEGAKEVRDLLPEEERAAFAGEIAIDQAMRIFRMAEEIQDLRLFDGREYGAPELVGTHEQKMTTLRNWAQGQPRTSLTELVLSEPREDCELQRIVQFAEMTRNNLPEQEQNLVAGAITIDRAARIFQITSELSLLHLFQDGTNGAPPLTEEREENIRVLRNWLMEHGREITEINAEERGLLCFPRELLFCPLLRKLILSNNEIRSLPPEIEMFRHLEELFVEGTELTAFPDELCTLPFLSYLYAGCSCLTKVPSLNSLRNLRYVDLSENALIELDFDFLSLRSLEEVYLEGNEGLEIPGLEESALRRIVDEYLIVDIIPIYMAQELLYMAQELLRHGSNIRTRSGEWSAVGDYTSPSEDSDTDYSVEDSSDSEEEATSDVEESSEEGGPDVENSLEENNSMGSPSEDEDDSGEAVTRNFLPSFGSDDDDLDGVVFV
jgi:hypothetical protein